MNRRQAVSRVALLLGGTILGAEFFLSGCKAPNNDKNFADNFTEKDIAFLNEVAETIIPATPDSGGGKAAKVGEFMKIMVADCYFENDQKVFYAGIEKLNQASKDQFSKGFMNLSADDRTALLTKLNDEVKEYKKNKKKEDPTHYFDMMKQLTLTGYFTSEVGCTQALRYEAVPGRYDGAMDYKKGDKAWAT
jgi:predicted house-cleaning noncanonical NTP pyrophosphatase (MazG superfamily)